MTFLTCFTAGWIRATTAKVAGLIPSRDSASGNLQPIVLISIYHGANIIIDDPSKLLHSYSQNCKLLMNGKLIIKEVKYKNDHKKNRAF